MTRKDISPSLSPLQEAWKVQVEAGKKGFDWPDVWGVIEKLEEEIEEIKKAVREEVPSQIFEELGDLLFAVVNLSRFLKVNPEEALKKAIGKFQKRFRKVEKMMSKRGRGKFTLEEMNQFWEKTKSS